MDEVILSPNTHNPEPFSIRLANDELVPDQYLSADGCGRHIERLKKDLKEGAAIHFRTNDPEFQFPEMTRGYVVKKYPHWVLVKVVKNEKLTYLTGFTYYEMWKGAVKYGL